MGKKIKIIIDVTELGRKGGKATAAARTPEERKAAGQVAIKARWEKYYAEHPDKLKAKLERQTAKLRASRKEPKKRGKAA